jgi:hypothetical protein
VTLKLYFLCLISLSVVALALLCAASLLHLSAGASRLLVDDDIEKKKKKHKKKHKKGGAGDLAYGIMLDAGSGSTKGAVWYVVSSRFPSNRR